MTEDGLLSWCKKYTIGERGAAASALGVAPAFWLLSEHPLHVMHRSGAGTDMEGNAGGPVLDGAQLTRSITGFRPWLLFAAAAIAIIIVMILWTRHNLEPKRPALDQGKKVLERDVDDRNRYTEAVKQLGADSPAVRLRGIHALEKIAQNSVRYRQSILDVLWSYLRSESPLQKKFGKDKTGMNSAADAAAIAAGHITHLSPPTKITILPAVNLAGAILAGAVFDGANLTDAILTGADLTNASFDGADLDGVSFITATLHRASFADADLIGADLTGASIIKASFISADLTGADLTGADLTDAYFLDANLTGANFSGARLTGAKFTRANLSRTHISEMAGGTLMETPMTRKYLKDNGAKSFQTAKGLPNAKN